MLIHVSLTIKHTDFFIGIHIFIIRAKVSGAVVVNNENDLDTCGFMASGEVCLSYPRLVVSVSSSLGCNSLQERFR